MKLDEIKSKTKCNLDKLSDALITEKGYPRAVGRWIAHKIIDAMLLSQTSEKYTGKPAKTCGAIYDEIIPYDQYVVERDTGVRRQYNYSRV